MLDEEIEIGPNGGAGSAIPWYELLDARALRLAADRATKGAKKYAPGNWRAVEHAEHIRHAIGHALEVLEPAQQYVERTPNDVLDSMAGFVCRAIMAAAVYLQDPGVEDKVPKGLACTTHPVEYQGDANDVPLFLLDKRIRKVQ